MMTKEMVISLIVLHFVSDWILQPRSVAKRKTTSLKWMGKHVAVIHVAFALYAWYFGISQFNVAVNTFVHMVIDKSVWSLYGIYRGPFDGKYLEYNKCAEDYWYYFAIAIDQIMHLVILVLILT